MLSHEKNSDRLAYTQLPQAMTYVNLAFRNSLVLYSKGESLGAMVSCMSELIKSDLKCKLA